MAKSKTITNGLTKQTLRILDLAGFKVWRQNNAAVYDATKGIYRRGSATPGISDIIGFHRKTGQFIAVEIKTGKDRLSDEQRNFLSDVEKAGGVAFVVKTFDDVITVSELYNRPPLMKTVKKLEV